MVGTFHTMCDRIRFYTKKKKKKQTPPVEITAAAVEAIATTNRIANRVMASKTQFFIVENPFSLSDARGRLLYFLLYIYFFFDKKNYNTRSYTSRGGQWRKRGEKTK